LESAAMAYDPFTRGPRPVGVRTLDALDASRGRRLPIELWYPAHQRHAGRDTAPGTRDTYELMPGLPPVHQDAVRDAEAEPGEYPLVAFSHGFGGHRRQSTFSLHAPREPRLRRRGGGPHRQHRARRAAGGARGAERGHA